MRESMSPRKQEILQIVFRLIAQEGIQELTMKRIAREVGITEPAIYRHFSSKAEILSALVEEIISIRLGIFQKANMYKEDPEQYIRIFFEGHARLFEEQPVMTIILFSDEMFRYNPDLMERIASMMEEAIDRIATIVRKGVRSNLFYSSVDDRMVSYLLLGGFRLLVSTWYLGGKQFSLVEDAKKFVETSLQFLMNRGSMQKD